MKFVELTQETCWESDKSVAFEADESLNLTEVHRGKTKNIRIFIPVSMIEERDGIKYISEWIINKKRDELKNNGFNSSDVDTFLDNYLVGDRSFEKDDSRFKLTGIFDFLEDASRNLNTPKLVFDESFGRIKLARAGSKSKHHGKIFITNGEEWGSPDRVFYGSIDLTGLFTPSNDAVSEVKRFLRKLDEDTAGVVEKYGKSSGNCCFCQKALTQDRSKSVGYGPKCASNYGLDY
jgi:hypothetical protein